MALSGLGGDETFAGYERYLGFNLSLFYNRVPGFLRKGLLKNAIGLLPESTSGGYRINHLKRFARSDSDDHGERYLGYLTKISEKYRAGFFSDNGLSLNSALLDSRDLILKHYNSSNAEHPVNRMLYTDLKTYLPEDILACTDRMSMHHALEVRVPFVDHRLVEYSATIPHQLKLKWLRKKYLLKKGTADLLPGPIIKHRKQGFVGPLTRWIQTDLKTLIMEKLSENNLGKHGLLNHECVERILNDHFRGREINDTLIWSLLIFQIWYEKYLH